MKNQILSRYRILDEYTLNELIYKYKNSDASEKIRLMEKLYEELYELPFEIASLAVTDQDIRVRIWIARYGQGLSYDFVFADGERQQHPERNLEKQLENDPDPQVRATLRENPDVFGGILRCFDVYLKKTFNKSNHRERLALVKNKEVCPELIEKIFDQEDTALDLNTDERKELALAFFSNPSAGEDFIFNKLWELASKWGEDSEKDIKYGIYKYVDAFDITKSEAYQSSENPLLRQAILDGCDWMDNETLTLGINDKDEVCRIMAYERIRLNPEKIEECIVNKDKQALAGLAINKKLSIDMHNKVKEALAEFEKYDFADRAYSEVEEIEKKEVLKDHDKLFGREGRKDDFLHDKIDIIGKGLLKIEKRMRDNDRAKNEMIQSLAKWLSLAFALIFLISIIRSCF